MAFEHAIDKIDRSRRLDKRAHSFALRAWLASLANPLIDIGDDVAERACPALLMAAGKMRVAARIGQHERGILHENAIRFVMAAEPKFVLALLIPQ